MRRRLDRTAADGVHVAVRQRDAAAATSRAAAVDDRHHAGPAADGSVLPDGAAASRHASVHRRLHQDHLVRKTLRLERLQATVFSTSTPPT